MPMITAVVHDTSAVAITERRNRAERRPATTSSRRLPKSASEMPAVSGFEADEAVTATA